MTAPAWILTLPSIAFLTAAIFGIWLWGLLGLLVAAALIAYGASRQS